MKSIPLLIPSVPADAKIPGSKVVQRFGCRIPCGLEVVAGGIVPVTWDHRAA
jgi:hypothetical protein